MKKSTCLIILFLSVTIGKAQLVKGTHLIDLQINGWYESHTQTDYGDTSQSNTYGTDYSHLYEIDIGPLIGFMTKENTMLGVGPTFRRSESEDKSNSGIGQPASTSAERLNTYNYYGAQIIFRRFYELNGNLYWNYSLNAKYSYGTGKINYVDYNYSRSSNLYSHNVDIIASAGFAYRLNEYWIVNGGLGEIDWSHSWNKETKPYSSDLAARFTDTQLKYWALSVNLGVSFLFPKP